MVNAATLVVNAYQSGNEEGLYANKIDPNTLKTIITAMCVPRIVIVEAPILPIMVLRIFIVLANIISEIDATIALM